ncbi:cold shock domain-containing protein [Mycolicibacterium sp. J2]|jgi:cold shock CspA family protein|uniref:cold shock domain-containing protein n=1 Tax=Mycolicibacterium sp. J2 TaxID=2993511 RepID=UPI00224B90EC|nr:cold shock domain-containing protein [Mycolicibacterium sp. J2]MCX2713647.1 cold shock domain-containing protein [Mycolicibacterium sp. J2]
MTSVGTVQIWHPDDGWGVLASAETPGGCFAHFSDIWANDSVLRCGYRELLQGETVDFEWEHAPAGGQDGYSFRATSVTPRRSQ